MHLTQPAVSIQLKNFQDQFSIPLTEVVGRKLYVTDFGKEIAVAAKKILNEVDAINYKTLSYKGELVGRLKFSVVSTGKYVIPYMLSNFSHQNKGVDLVIDVTNKVQVIESLELNTVDFAMVSVLPKKLKVERVELMQNKLYLIAGKKGLSNKGLSRKKIFEQSPLIYREAGSATRAAMENFIIKNKFEVRKKIELTSNEAVKQAVIAGLGFSIMPIIGLKNELRNNDVQIIPIKGLPIRTNWNLIWLKSKKLSPSALAFLEYLKDDKSQVMKENFDWIDAY